MNSKLFLISTLLFAQVVNAQTTKPPAINEIDRLCQKYKGMDSVEITNAYGTFYAYISVEFNDEGKPKEISISGSVAGAEIQAVERFINDIIIQKKAKGYHEVNSDFIPTGYNIALTKGYLYTRISKKYQDTEPIHLGNGFDPIPSMHYIEFSVTDGDVKRAAGKGSNNIDF